MTAKLVDEISNIIDTFIQDVSNFGNIPSIDKLDLIDVFAGQKFTYIDALSDSLVTSGQLSAAAKQAISRAFIAVSAIMEVPEVVAAYNSGDMSEFRAQIAGVFGSVAGGVLGYATGYAIGGIVATTILTAAAAGTLPAVAIVGIFTVIGAAAFGYIFESMAEKNWREMLERLFNTPPCDPIVIDLDGDGIELTSLNRSNAYFDLDGDGFAEHTGWVTSDDALLAVDLNGNGRIDSIDELFGSEVASGYHELAPYDSNGDGRINAQDTNFSKLMLWRDLNGNGASEAGELQSLTSAGIASISLDHGGESRRVNGNTIVATSAVAMTDGTTTQAGEVLFDLDQHESTFILPENFEYDLGVFVLPYLPGMGDIPDLWVSMSMDAGLQGKTNTLIEDARAGDFSDFIAGFDAFLADWADVEDAQWMQDEFTLGVIFAYDANEYASYMADHAAGNYSAKPRVKGYIFDPFSDRLTSDEIEEWLEENNYTAPGIHFDFSNSPHPLPLGATLGASLTSAPLSGPGIRYTGRIMSGFLLEEEDPAPTMDPRIFSFLQMLMGQELGRGGNFITPDWLLVSNPSPVQIERMMAAYELLKDDFMSRFLVQAAHGLIAKGEDPGALAPFANLYYNPFTNTITGDGEAFVIDLITLYRDEELGTDLDALGIISMFSPGNPYLGVYVIVNFPDIPRADIETILNTTIDLDGTVQSDSLVLGASGVVLAHDGNDSVQGSSDQDIIHGGKGDDTLAGGRGSDTYLYSRGEGHDTIIEATNAGSNDQLMLMRVGVSDVTFVRNGIDLTLVFAESAPGASDGGSILLKGALDDASGRGVEKIVFADGTTWDGATMRNRMVSDMKATGTVVGTENDETYRHTSGDGSYSITDYDYNRGADRLVFTDLNPGDLTLSRSASNTNLVLTLANGEKITLVRQLDEDTRYSIETLQFADGTTWSQADLRNRMVSDMKATGTVVGTENDETYRHTSGDGSYSITDYDYNRGADRLVFTDLNPGDLTLSRSASNTNLVLTLANGEKITLVRQLDEDTRYSIETLQFADGTTWSQADLRNRMVSDMKATGTVVGTENDETYRHTSGDGSYSITDYDYNRGADRLVFTDVNPGDLTLSRSASNTNLVLTLANGEKITLVRQLDEDTRYSIETLQFADGTTWSQADLRNRMVSDMKATGTVVGTENDETYRHTSGDGSYSITDYDYNRGADRLVFTDVNPGDLTLSRSASNTNLVLTLANGEKITLVRQLDEDTRYSIETLQFADGTTWSQADLRNRMVSDMKATGTVVGTENDETYRHTSGDGSYSITDYDYNRGADRLVFTDVNPGDLTLSRSASNTNLVLTLANGEKITLVRQLDEDTRYSIETLQFADGTTWSQADLRNRMVSDMKATGTVVGTENDETYRHTSGDGSYSITDYDYNRGNDVLIFNDVSSTNVTVRRLLSDPKDVVITLANGEHITLQDQLTSNNRYGVEQIVFSDNVTWARANLASAPIIDDELVYM